MCASPLSPLIGELGYARIYIGIISTDASKLIGFDRVHCTEIVVSILSVPRRCRLQLAEE